jgi:hypothetical protein
MANHEFSSDGQNPMTSMLSSRSNTQERLEASEELQPNPGAHVGTPPEGFDDSRLTWPKEVADSQNFSQPLAEYSNSVGKTFSARLVAPLTDAEKAASSVERRH